VETWKLYAITNRDHVLSELFERVARDRREYLAGVVRRWAGRSTCSAAECGPGVGLALHRWGGSATGRRCPVPLQGPVSQASRSAVFAAPGVPSNPIVHMPVPSSPSSRNRRHFMARARESST